MLAPLGRLEPRSRFTPRTTPSATQDTHKRPSGSLANSHPERLAGRPQPSQCVLSGFTRPRRGEPSTGTADRRRRRRNGESHRADAGTTEAIDARRKTDRPSIRGARSCCIDDDGRAWVGSPANGSEPQQAKTPGRPSGPPRGDGLQGCRSTGLLGRASGGTVGRPSGGPCGPRVGDLRALRGGPTEPLADERVTRGHRRRRADDGCCCVVVSEDMADDGNAVWLRCLKDKAADWFATNVVARLPAGVERTQGRATGLVARASAGLDHRMMTGPPNARSRAFAVASWWRPSDSAWAESWAALRSRIAFNA